MAKPAEDRHGLWELNALLQAEQQQAGTSQQENQQADNQQAGSPRGGNASNLQMQVEYSSTPYPAPSGAR